MDKLIIEVRINEYASRKDNANVPFSPEEICDSALRCYSSCIRRPDTIPPSSHLPPVPRARPIR